MGISTYNQIDFPGHRKGSGTPQRWVNLQVEHELYCHGLLIEAAVSHYEATGERRLLSVRKKPPT